MNRNFIITGRSARRIALTLAIGASVPLAALAHSDHAGHSDHAKHADHSAHRATAAATPVTRTSEHYQLPQAALVRADGAKVSLAQEIDSGKPVVLNFIFTSCNAVCPLMSQTFAAFAQQLGRDRDGVHMVSISIDPEHDTPARLAEYAARMGAHPQWQHYTGSVENSIAVQRAFKAYRGDKMGHTPATFLRAAPGQPWVRLDGFVSATELLAEYRKLTARTAASR